LALHPGVHEVGVIAWVTGVPVDEIEIGPLEDAELVEE